METCAAVMVVVECDFCDKTGFEKNLEKHAK